eukprot:976798_1
MRVNARSLAMQTGMLTAVVPMNFGTDESVSVHSQTESIVLAVVYVAVYNPQIQKNSRLDINRHGRSTNSLAPLASEWPRDIEPEAFWMIARSTVVMNGETKKAARP